MTQVSGWVYGGAGVAHLLCLLYLFAVRQRSTPEVWLVVALLASVVWALGGWFISLNQLEQGLFVALVFEWLRLAAWSGLIVSMLTPGHGLYHRARVGVCALFGVILVLIITLGSSAFTNTVMAYIAVAGLLAACVVGLMLLEQVYRAVPMSERWGLKPICLGLLAIFAFELYYYAEALLFGRLEEGLWSGRAALSVMVLPLVMLSNTRNPALSVRMRLSHSVAFHSTALMLSGAYLLVMAAAGYYLRYFGGEWGQVLQISLMLGAGLLLGVWLISDSQRARLRVIINKHLFPYRYDYRTEWLKFTHALSRAGDSLTLGQSVIKALGDLVESPGGVLWLADEQGQCKPHARFNHARADGQVSLDSVFCHFLEDREWVINLEEWRASPTTYQELTLPDWLERLTDAWLVVPLKSSHGLIGFVVLNAARTPFEINWEVLDLLKSAQRQAASYLAQMQAAEALLEARKFDAFNKMSAFVVHDLKNLVAQLSLMLKNAQKHKHNPEFQADMLATVANVEQRMLSLLQQLQAKTAIDPARRVDLNALLSGLVQEKRALADTPIYFTAWDAPAWVTAHSERLRRNIGHVLQNALEACEGSATVSVTLTQPDECHFCIRIEDEGVGMDEEFIRERLFRPFESSKEAGMGIGVFEVQQYLKELGGSIHYSSRVGAGTTAEMLLPRSAPSADS